MASSTFSALPRELLLEIIPHIPHSPSQLLALRLTNRTMACLLTSHEKGLVTAIRKQQYPSAVLAVFPGLLHTYLGLNILHTRLQTLSTISANWEHLTSYSPDLGWLRDRWLSIHHVGTLLLYRLQDCSTLDARTDLLNALPATSLACICFKLYSSIKVLRIYGPEPIHAQFCKEDMAMRVDIELAFEEMLLHHGPDFFVGLLQAGRSRDPDSEHWAIRTLNCEIAAIESRQMLSHAPTLISTLRRSFAAKLECRICESTSRMWELLSGTVFDRMGDEVMVRVVNGRSLGAGMRRMGW